MFDYLDKLLHIKAEVAEFTQTDSLPLYIRNNYIFNVMKLAGVECLVAKPKENVNFAALRKQQMLLKNETGMECVLCFEKLNQYAKNKMTAEGMPFIIEAKQVYMPFLGIAIGQHDRQLTEIGKISFLTQKLLLTAIYQHWSKVFLFEAAGLLKVSDMSISRSFDELEALGLSLIAREGKGRCFMWNGSKRQLWDLAFSFLCDPVNKTFSLATGIDDKRLILSGISALCHYSMLADNVYQTFAVTKAAAREMQLNKQVCVPTGEVPAMVIQVLHYNIPFDDGKVIDPLTAVLSITQAEKSDPRVEVAIDEILEEYLSD